MEMKTELKIRGMHCASCAKIVERALKKQEGVSEASVSFASEKAILEHDASVTPEHLIKAVEGAGYRARIIGEDEFEKEMKERKQEISELKRLLLVSAVFSVPALLISMFLMELPYREFILFLLATPVQFYVGKRFYVGAYHALMQKSANMDTLIALGTSAAYFYSVSSFFIKGEQYFEIGAVLITLVMLGKLLEAIAKGKASEAIRKLISLAPKKARIIRNGREKEIDVDDVVVGDIIRVRPGEKVPVDGIVIEGASAVDESMITGESIPVEKTKGAKVIGGAINKFGSFSFKATQVGEGTTLAHIIKLVAQAQASRAPIQRFADRVSAFFVPVVVVIALVTFSVWIAIGGAFSFALISAVSVLVIACPCALGLATPTAIMVGTEKGASNGILIKDAAYLEKIKEIDVVVFDKTGTITVGKPVVTNVEAMGMSEEKLLEYAAAVEKHSEHPLAEAVVNEAKNRRISFRKASGFKAVPGKGVEASVGGRKAYVGKPDGKDRKLTARINALESKGKTVLLAKLDGKPVGFIAVADVIKDTSVEAVRQLKKAGIEPYIITGDNERTARAIAEQVGIKKFFAGVLPHEKADYVKKLQDKKLTVAMVGDGINDAPALASADVGIVMGSGTDVAIETGHIVLVKNDLRDVPRAIRLGKMTLGKIKQNMFWALIYNVIGIPVAAGALSGMGITLSPAIAGGAMALSSVSVVSNSLLLRYKRL
ncbi:cadmium-translocating P-type ATPase [Candidatus Micrarchaeota archaeon]|nr:cadmium-translocating P-type ATPase [Candidatus Micrarchaeota archaeon]